MYNERRPHTGDILPGGVYMCNERRPHTGDILSGGVYMYNERRPHTRDIPLGGVSPYVLSPLWDIFSQGMSPCLVSVLRYPLVGDSSSLKVSIFLGGLFTTDLFKCHQNSNQYLTEILPTMPRK